MTDGGRHDPAFDAIRQFTVRPDRRYRVETRGEELAFRGTGSQFDVRWLVRGARSVLGDRIADAFERSSGTKLLIGGIAVAVISGVVLLLCMLWAAGTTVPLRGSHVRGMGVLGFTCLVGVIMTIAGIATRRTATAGSRNDFRLALSDIVDASLLPPQSELARRGEPQVARLHLRARSGDTFRFGLPTDDDLETVKSVIPALAA